MSNAYHVLHQRFNHRRINNLQEQARRVHDLYRFHRREVQRQREYARQSRLQIGQRDSIGRDLNLRNYQRAHYYVAFHNRLMNRALLTLRNIRNRVNRLRGNY